MSDDFYWSLKVKVGRKGYNPDQPRVPAGDPRGGQWMSSLLHGDGPDFSDEDIEVYVSSPNRKLPSRVINADISDVMLSPEGQLSVGLGKGEQEPDHAWMLDLIESGTGRMDVFTRGRIRDGKLTVNTWYSGLGDRATRSIDWNELDATAYNKIRKLAGAMIRAGYPGTTKIKWRALKTTVPVQTLEDWKAFKEQFDDKIWGDS